MNRRGFIGAMLGAAAVTALPSEVWPFRKIFLPVGGLARGYGGFFSKLLRPGLRANEVVLWDKPIPELYEPGTIGAIMRSAYPPLERIDHLDVRNWGRHPLMEANVQAIELEKFAKEIPDLIYGENRLFQLMSRDFEQMVKGDIITVQGYPAGGDEKPFVIPTPKETVDEFLAKSPREVARDAVRTVENFFGELDSEVRRATRD